MEGLRDVPVLVTGAARGIGLAIARRLAAEGAALALVDVDEDALSAAAEELDALAVRRWAGVLDVSDPAACVRAVDAAVDALGPLGGLVNNAGIGPPAKFLDLTVEQWRRTLEVNLTGTFVLTQHVGRLMAVAGRGRIVNIASIAGKTGASHLADYCASKAGVISLTQSAALALGPSGVTVNAVCPGLVWTPMWRATATWLRQHDPSLQDVGSSPEEVFDHAVRSATPLHRPTAPEDVAAAVAWLLSDDARQVTGQAINVDGGIELH